MYIQNIKWDTDKEKVELPTMVQVPNELADYEIADYLSDRFGWLVISFDIE